MNKLTFIIVFVFFSNCLFAQGELQITYIGNMGILISSDQQSVLIDGLHKKYKAYYQYPSNELVKKIIANKSFADICLLLNTHIHKDHFEPNLVLSFLQNNPQAQLIGPSQTKQAVIALNPKVNIQERIKAVEYQEHTKTFFEHQGIRVTAFYLSHANPGRHHQTENIGYLIELNNKKLLHVGDTGWNEDLFKVLDLEKEGIDIAILPNWLAMYDEGIHIINTYIQSKKIIATHISPFEQQTVRTAIQKHFPTAVMFTEIGQEVSIF